VQGKVAALQEPDAAGAPAFEKVGDFARRIGFAVPLSGTQTTGVVRCDQPRVLDLNARNGRRVESLPAAILDEILAKTSTIFQ